MANGIVRKIDELGRITIPIEVRRSRNLHTGDRPEIVMDGQIIRIKTKESRAMTRPIDELGRIVIPMEIRRMLGFIAHQKVDMWVEGNDVCIQKFHAGCVICESTDNLMDVNGVPICRKCGLKVIDRFAEE